MFRRLLFVSGALMLVPPILVIVASIISELGLVFDAADGTRSYSFGFSSANLPAVYALTLGGISLLIVAQDIKPSTKD